MIQSYYRSQPDLLPASIPTTPHRHIYPYRSGSDSGALIAKREHSSWSIGISNRTRCIINPSVWLYACVYVRSVQSGMRLPQRTIDRSDHSESLSINSFDLLCSPSSVSLARLLLVKSCSQFASFGRLVRYHRIVAIRINSGRPLLLWLGRLPRNVTSISNPRLR